MLKITSAAFIGLAGTAHAFWRMECPGRLDVARIDPIVNPGEVSAHAHTLHGSSGLAASSDSDSLRAGDCTSCRVTQDHSAYWTPPMYFQDANNGSFELVEQVGGMLAYYLLYGDNITAFPDNFRMIAGSNERRSYTVGDPSKPDPGKSNWAALGQTGQKDLQQRALGFNCLNYQRPPEGTLYRHYLPDKEYLDANCADGIRLELMFPSCWNGKDIDSPDHSSHMAYPDLVMTGTCPEGFETRVPSMLFETIWNTAAFKGRDGRFVISNGDTEGFAYHGDFMMGWEPKFLQQAVDTCTNPSGLIEDCPIFNVVDHDTATSCKLQKSLPGAILDEVEDMFGPMKALPGDLAVFDDNNDPSLPEVVTSALPSGSKPNLSYTPGSTPSNAASPVPGQVFKEVSHAVALPTPSSTSTSTPAPPTQAPPTKAPPAQAPAAAAVTEAAISTAEPSFFSTQFVTNGHVVSEILWEEEFVTVTETVNALPTQSAPQAKRRRSHLHAHARRS